MPAHPPRLAPLQRLWAALRGPAPRPRPAFDLRHASTRPGVSVAGDLADAPVIKLAAVQGHAVAEGLLRELGSPTADSAQLDLLIVGAGPAGIGAALAAVRGGHRVRVIERDRPLATLRAFPDSKILYGEPRDLPLPEGLPFDDGPAADLIAAWTASLRSAGVEVLEGEELIDLEGPAGALVAVSRGPTGERRHRARRVLLAIGRRGPPARLGVPGDDRPEVHTTDAAAPPPGPAVVVGGGDSAAELAVRLAADDRPVTLVHRGEGLPRLKPQNRAEIERLVDAGALQLRLGRELAAVHPGAVTLRPVAPGAPAEPLPAASVWPRLGHTLPLPLLDRLGLRLQGARGPLGWLASALFAVFVWCFYVLKSGLTQGPDGGWAPKRALFPFAPGDPLAAMPGLLRAELGPRVVDGAFWGTVVYTAVVVIFGLRALGRARLPAQRRRLWALMGFQGVLLFGVPELLAPALIHLGGEGGPLWQLFGGDRGWKIYSLTVPWPLNLWALTDAPGWTATGSAPVALLWLLLAASVSFVLIPLYVRRYGQAFCSTLCGCGGLAETLGDPWRDRAPRGPAARQLEWGGRGVLLLAAPTTALILADAWGLLRSGALLDARHFAERWYGLAVDFGLAGVLGVALYPHLGNRAWCRFFCPLRAWMELLAKRFSRVAIQSDGRCISCGECTRACQMGIDVMRFAQEQLPLDNSGSACIQCGVCIEVCPMDVLRLERGQPLAFSPGPWLEPPRAPWERANRDPSVMPTSTKA